MEQLAEGGIPCPWLVPDCDCLTCSPEDSGDTGGVFLNGRGLNSVPSCGAMWVAKFSLDTWAQEELFVSKGKRMAGMPREGFNTFWSPAAFYGKDFIPVSPGLVILGLSGSQQRLLVLSPESPQASAASPQPSGWWFTWLCGMSHDLISGQTVNEQVAFMLPSVRGPWVLPW